MSTVCINGFCSSKELEAPCTVNTDCNSGYCNLVSMVGGLPYGHCASGEIGTRCSGDAACKSGNCALFTGLRGGGLCTAGVTGDPCASDDDCVDRKCGPGPAATADVCGGRSPKPPNAPCGDGGVCATDFSCHYQRCE